MPKADSDDSTTPSGDTASSKKKKVASSRKTPPNEATGKRKPANQTEHSSMSKTATAKANPTALALQSSQPLVGRRQIMKRATTTIDPIFGLLELYGKQAVAEGRARYAIDCFDESLPAPHHRQPRVTLALDKFAISAAEIDAFFDETPEFAQHIADTWIGANSREEHHKQLQLDVEGFQRVWSSLSYEQARDEYAAAQAAEHETLQEIERAVPITVEGCAALASFLLSIITEGGVEDDTLGASHCNNLLRALTRLSRRPVPDVVGYYHSNYSFD
ncbi:hypothetical protein QA645_19420 [Bradyrhizobium sp. CIAT3101]|uniref:hypothetical protein n=1 Tax=Bradyrhizobium sp. CIAT3101 TaxID=439387 RepID=UPI0024B0A995|nr:hypothetical protein [Bradyrhizobium sp. CIAT3101]WFU84826.1 hypothetical protein QA645_19420 [Bradyrhizobium sp. CIAT3101]